MTQSNDIASKRLHIEVDKMDWQPAAEVFPELDVGIEDPNYGVFLKVFRRPDDDGNGCWAFLSRYIPPPGKAFRVVAIARSDEELFFLEGGFTDRSGRVRVLPPIYAMNPDGLRHGGIMQLDTTVLNHYHGRPDEVLSVELIDAVGLPEPTGWEQDEE